MLKYSIITYGCQMNVHESEKLAGMLSSLGYTEETDRLKANVIIFNTCSIREGAEDRAFGNIGALKKFKQQNKDVIIAVGGCVTQDKLGREKLLKKFPFVDIVFGTKNLHLFKEFLQKRLITNKKVVEINEDDLMPTPTQILRTSNDNAYVNIIYGCNNFCTYCIVPYVRGRERSRPLGEIVSEVKELVAENKYKTITLLGQNVNSYGTDINKQTNFLGLLEELVKIPGVFKLKFMTSHPKDASTSLFKFIGKNLDKISNEFHLPVQSGSNKILSLMNRKYTREHYLTLVDAMRKYIPNVNISTDIIVGFPGETEEDYQDTLKLLSEVKFDNIFAYMYSVRGGTPAEKMEGQVDYKIKNKRVNETLKTFKQITREKKNGK